MPFALSHSKSYEKPEPTITLNKKKLISDKFSCLILNQSDMLSYTSLVIELTEFSYKVFTVTLKEIKSKLIKVDKLINYIQNRLLAPIN